MWRNASSGWWNDLCAVTVAAKISTVARWAREGRRWRFGISVTSHDPTAGAIVYAMYDSMKALSLVDDVLAKVVAGR